MASVASRLLPGKVVAITGCSTGIGRAVAIGKSNNPTTAEMPDTSQPRKPGPRRLTSDGSDADRPGCAKNGANMVLHHLGDSTLSDIKEVEKECVAAGAKTVIVGGDISNEKTATDVSDRLNLVQALFV